MAMPNPIRFDKDDVVITDPCYFMRSSSDWDECDCGQCLERLGLSSVRFYSNSTGVGDGTWNVRNLVVRKEKIGTFSADSGQIGAFYLEDVLKYNPKFLTKHRRLDRLALILRNFTGEIGFFYSPTSDHAMQVEIRGDADGKYIYSNVDLNLLDN
jgi:hypothetical protein